MPFPSALPLLLVLLLMPGSVLAATSVLTPTADAHIIASVPANNTGAHTHAAAGTSGTFSTRRALFRFDLTTIPAGANVTAASLAIDVVGGPLNLPADSTFNVFRLSRTWGEGTKLGSDGAPATAGEVTWASSEHGVTSWTAAGGDFAGASSGAAFVTGIATYTFTNAQLLSDVQSMVDTASGNHGWLLKSDLEATLRTARRFGTLEGGAPALLTVEYDPVSTPVPALPGVALAVLGSVLLGVSLFSVDFSSRGV